MAGQGGVDLLAVPRLFHYRSDISRMRDGFCDSGEEGGDEVEHKNRFSWNDGRRFMKKSVKFQIGCFCKVSFRRSHAQAPHQFGPSESMR